MRIHTLPREGIPLNTGWRFISGDNLGYADPDYNDTQWQNINPALDIHEIPQLWKNSIVWFRLHFTVDSSIIDELAMIVEQSGASEIYINGQLIKKFGTVSNNVNGIRAYEPSGKPFHVSILNDRQNIIAFRYALQPGITYSLHINRLNPVFRIRINNLDYAIQKYNDENISSATSNVFRIGVFLIFLILHLAFYLYYPAQKANLYFSLYALLALCFEISQFNTSHFIAHLYNGLFFQFAAFHISYLVLLTALYELLNKKRGKVYWALVILVTSELLIDRFTYRFGDFIQVYILSNLVTLEIARISYSALKNGQRGAWIIATGATSFLIFWAIFVCGRYFHFQYRPLGHVYGYGDLLSNLALLSLPVATSVYLGLDFAFTNTVLQNKLVEVEMLSRKNLAQEKEKQQILASQKELLDRQVTTRTAELKRSLENLKSTQSQLIQSEKMASLGELTAGIAHEIQNPLNFVNNFSEVNNELIEELENELKSNNNDEAILIAKDIKENEQKINHHGRRAGAIVKNMLQHSRSSGATRELTDINRFADEYLRLSYHGLRAKDKSFNAEIKTDFDKTIDKINIVPQDIGRVLLNLINNAFYAVNEKLRAQSSQLTADYNPLVSVQTRKINNEVQIRVSDNGNGIPQKILDKIFQPFFTTKPTGQGTGLGLSLAYDIVKAHGGEIKVETKEGEGCEFIIQLPTKGIEA
ncbi:MAG TPA: ATP-binding protein [Chitinophagaceae bacterium]|nr:ATP-binding protein [Chitinophagaceae bacterium]